MRKIVKFIKNGIRHIEAVVWSEPNREPDRPPHELYAYSVVVVFKDAAGQPQLFLSGGMTLAPSKEEVRKHAIRVTAELMDDQLIEIEESDIELVLSHSHVLTPVILEGVKREYNLVDNLSLWREQLDGASA